MLPLCLLLVTLTPVLGGDILSVASSNGCGKVVSLIEAAGLADTLKAAHDVTFFAPSDDAIAHVPGDVMRTLQSNATLLQDVLKFHVVTRLVRAGDVSDGLKLPTLDGGLSMTMNVYAQPQVVSAEGSRVIHTDLTADNGVVHVLDKVIFPLPTTSLTLALTFHSDLTNLAYMIYQAKLTETLNSNENEYTIFAPSNEALNRIPGQEYNDLIMNITRLRDVLLTHVVPRTLFSVGLHDGQSLTNIQHTHLAVTAAHDGLQVNKKQVIHADIPATNGVIHIIDGVFIPDWDK